MSSAIRACIARTAIHVKPILTLYTVAPHTAGRKTSSLSEAIATHLAHMTTGDFLKSYTGISCLLQNRLSVYAFWNRAKTKKLALLLWSTVCPPSKILMMWEYSKKFTPSPLKLLFHQVNSHSYSPQYYCPLSLRKPIIISSKYVKSLNVPPSSVFT